MPAWSPAISSERYRDIGSVLGSVEEVGSVELAAGSCGRELSGSILPIDGGPKIYSRNRRVRASNYLTAFRKAGLSITHLSKRAFGSRDPLLDLDEDATGGTKVVGTGCVGRNFECIKRARTVRVSSVIKSEY